jgi:hypothetical protein
MSAEQREEVAKKAHEEAQRYSSLNNFNPEKTAVTHIQKSRDKVKLCEIRQLLRNLY